MSVSTRFVLLIEDVASKLSDRFCVVNWFGCHWGDDGRVLGKVTRGGEDVGKESRAIALVGFAIGVVSLNRPIKYTKTNILRW